MRHADKAQRYESKTGREVTYSLTVLIRATVRPDYRARLPAESSSNGLTLERNPRYLIHPAVSKSLSSAAQTVDVRISTSMLLISRTRRLRYLSCALLRPGQPQRDMTAAGLARVERGLVGSDAEIHTDKRPYRMNHATGTSMTGPNMIAFIIIKTSILDPKERSCKKRT